MPLAAAARRSSQNKGGPFLPLASVLECRTSSPHCGHWLQLQNLMLSEFTVCGTFQTLTTFLVMAASRIWRPTRM